MATTPSFSLLRDIYDRCSSPKHNNQSRQLRQLSGNSANILMSNVELFLRALSHIYSFAQVSICWNVPSGHMYTAGILTIGTFSVGTYKAMDFACANRAKYTHIRSTEDNRGGGSTSLSPSQPNKWHISDSIIIEFMSSVSDVPEKPPFEVVAIATLLKMKDELERTTARTNLIISNICHTVRTPLNGIIHITDDILDGNYDSTNLLKAAAVQLSSDLFDVIDLVGLEQKNVKLNNKMICLPELIDNVVDVVLCSCDNFTVYNEPNIPMLVYADGAKIKQLLITLGKYLCEHSANHDIVMTSSATYIVDSAHAATARAATATANAATANVANATSTTQTPLIKYESYELRFTFDNCNVSIASLYPLDEEIHYKNIELKICNLLAQLLGGAIELHANSVVLVFTVQKNEKRAADTPTIRTYNTIHITDNPAQSLSNVVASSCEEAALYSHILFDFCIIETSHIMNLRDKVHAKKYVAIADGQSAKITIEANAVDKIYNKWSDINFAECLNILVVEDEELNRRSMAIILRKLNYKNIAFACNGNSAIEMFKECAYDIVLVDIRLPDINGFQVAEAIYNMSQMSQMSQNSTTRIIGVTAHIVQESEHVPWLNQFIYKPINMQELKNRLI